MIVQLYNDRVMRGFIGNAMIFEALEVDWRKLDALGLPRLGKPAGKPWKETDWGWEISVDFSTKIRKKAAKGGQR